MFGLLYVGSGEVPYLSKRALELLDLLLKFFPGAIQVCRM